MPKTLLVDTNVSSVPIYNYLLNEGHEVYVVGANPKDFLAKTAPRHVELDYSEVAGMCSLIDRLRIDFLVPGCNDESYRVCAELNAGGRFFGIDSVRTTNIVNNKGAFRSFARECKLPVPEVYSPNEVDFNRPVIVKPVDAFSGRGMTVVHRGDGFDGLNSALNRAKSFSRTKACIVEEFISGQLYSHSAFITDRKIQIDFIVEEHGTVNPFAVDTSRVAYNFNAGILGKIRTDIERMATELSFCDGLVHTQFLLNCDQYWIVEVTRRCPGDLYSLLIELSTGFKYGDEYARPFIQQPLVAASVWPVPRKDWIVRHTLSLPVELSLMSVGFEIPLRILRFVPLAVAGDMVAASPFGRIGLLFAQSETQEEQDALFAQMLARNLYSLQ